MSKGGVIRFGIAQNKEYDHLSQVEWFGKDGGYNVVTFQTPSLDSSKKLAEEYIAFKQNLEEEILQDDQST